MPAFDRQKLDESLWYIVACASRSIQSISERALVNSIFSWTTYLAHRGKIALTEEMIRRSLSGLIGEGRISSVMRGGERYLHLSSVQLQGLNEEIEQEKFKNGLMRDSNSFFIRRRGG